MNIAIVTASGIGSRMECEIPKQFLTINDKPIVIYTLEALESNPNIDSIIVACLNGWEKVLESYIKQHNLNKVKWIVPGGDTGQQSIINCIECLKQTAKDDDIVIIHDGNRPLIKDFVINEGIRICKEKGNSIAGIPCTEAVISLNESVDTKCSGEVYDRDKLIRTQTPHCFFFKEICDLYQEVTANNIETVAACTAMVELGKRVYFSPGSELNFKITTQEDLRLFSALINQRDI